MCLKTYRIIFYYNQGLHQVIPNKLPWEDVASQNQMKSSSLSPVMHLCNCQLDSLEKDWVP